MTKDDLKTTRTEAQGSVPPPPQEPDSSGPVSPPAPSADHDGAATGGYEKRPTDSSKNNAKGGYGAG